MYMYIYIYIYIYGMTYMACLRLETIGGDQRPGVWGQSADANI